MASSSEQLQALARVIDGCTACRLYEGRTRIVFGEGNPESRVMFVGEGPGKDEDLSGRPFVGRAGQLLTKILASVDIAREDVYITNVVKCRPPGNRDPKDDEVAMCERYLLAQLDAIGPRVVVTMGNVATAFFLGPGTPGISKVRGRFHEGLGGVRVLPIFHPSYLLRNEDRRSGGPKWQTWQDMKLLAADLAGERP